jgi:hypothetical protein
MKYINGIMIIRQILDSFEEYEVLPAKSKNLVERIIEDLHYKRKILKDTLDFEKGINGGLFE